MGRPVTSTPGREFDKQKPFVSLPVIDSVLFTLGPLHIYAYGFMLALGYGAATVLALREAKRRNWPTDVMMDYAVYLFLAGLVGGRVVFIIQELPYFLAFPEEIFFLKNGLSSLGVILGAAVVSGIMARRHRWNWWELGDILSAPLALGLSFAAVGSSRLGRITGIPWAVVTDGQGFHPLGAYYATAYYLTFTVVWNLRRRSRFTGQLTLLAVFLLSLIRFIGEFFAADGVIVNLSQVLALVGMGISLALLRQGAERSIPGTGSKLTATFPVQRSWPWRLRRILIWLVGLVFLLSIYYLRA